MVNVQAVSQRIVTIDCARGLAILGILLLNIIGFGLPKAAYLNPAYQGIPSVTEGLVWAFFDLFAQAKFLSLFALLFGATLQLLMPRGSAWMQARLSWLLLLGALHGIFFWDGDILLPYALIGLICWRMIRDAVDVQRLFKTAIVLYLMGVMVLILLGVSSSHTPGHFWQPGLAELQYEQYWKLLGGSEAISNRLSLLGSALMAITLQYGWQLAGYMLLGAALLRSGWLMGLYPITEYRRQGWILIAFAVLIQLPGVILQWWLAWDYRWCGFLLQVPRELGSPLQALGYLALLYGYWPTLASKRLTGWLCSIGRMALTNYLLQTLICTILFYRLGLFNHYSRVQLMGFVIPIWAINIIFSVYWLRFFPQGPMEWGWRKLTAWSVK